MTVTVLPLQRQSLTHADRRPSTSSQTTSASSVRSLRLKMRGTPLSRARALARFFGRGRDNGRALLPLHYVHGEREIVLEVSHDMDVDEKEDEWVDEEAVGVNAV